MSGALLHIQSSVFLTYFNQLLLSPRLLVQHVSYSSFSGFHHYFWTYRSTVTRIMDPVQLGFRPSLVQIPRCPRRAHDIVAALHNRRYKNVSRPVSQSISQSSTPGRPPNAAQISTAYQVYGESYRCSPFSTAVRPPTTRGSGYNATRSSHAPADTRGPPATLAP
jgi:hypothetical protein